MKKKMKIAICGRLHSKSKHQGGSSMIALSLAKFMASQGHDVSFFGRDTPSSFVYDVLNRYDHKININYLSELPDFLYYSSMPLRAFWLLKNKFKNFDAVHTHIASFTFAASCLKRLNKKIKFVVSVHEILQPKYEHDFKAKLYMHGDNLLMKIACENADTVIVHSEYMKELVLRKWQIENSIIIRNGIDTSFFKPYVLNKEQHDKLWGCAEYKLLYVGRLDFRKGILQLIESVKYLIKDGLDIKLIVVGDGRLKQNIKNLVSNLNLTKYVYVFGRAKQEKLPYLYSSSDLTVVPSMYEPFGLVPLESLACGTPVVVSNNTGLKEVVEPNVGYYIDEITPKSIAESIKYAVSNGLPSEKCCRQYVCERYDRRDIYPLYEAIYRDC